MNSAMPVVVAAVVAALAPSSMSQVRRAGVDECSIQLDQTQGVYVAALWPGGVVPYAFSANVSEEHRQVALAAMAELESVCGCDFVARTNEPDYVRYQNSDANNSSVGKKGGLQVVNIANWTINTLLHESMHALGCWHEQQRGDRDLYVEVIDANIQPGQSHNFEKHEEDTTVGWYDFESVMHYSRFGWTSNGKATLIARPGFEAFERWMRATDHLSSGDRWVLTEMYGGEKPPGAFTPVGPADAQAVGADWAPGFAWTASEQADAYRLRVADNPGFVAPVIDVETVSTSYSGGVLKNGEAYYWTVEAINAQGSTRIWPLRTLVFYTGAAPGPVVYVDATSPGGDGSSWAKAFPDLADALGAGACAGGAPLEFRIAQGEYTPDRGTGDRGATFELRAGMTLRGGFGGLQNPGNPDQSGFETLLHGDLAGDDGPDFENYGDNTTHVLTVLWQDAAPITIDAMQIVGGNADGQTQPGPPGASGGGLLAISSDIHISNCLVRANSALALGGGIAAQDTDLLITDSTLEENLQTSPLYSDSGGGLSVWTGARPTVLVGTTFADNEALQGAAMAIELAALRVDRCTFDGNSARMWGSAIQIYGTADGDIRSSLFLDNEAASVDLGGGEGGAVNIFRNSGITVSNSLFAGNEAATVGGAIWIGLDSDLTVVNCTLSHNTAPQGGALVVSDGYGGHSTATVVNSILYGDAGGEIVNLSGGATSAASSNIQGGYGGFGNIDADPQLDGQFRPASGSPVNDAGLSGILDKDIVVDVYGAPRVSDDPDAPGGLVIDMGAVEFGDCAPDLNGDGTLNLFDFLMFVNLFNGNDDRADCDEDGGLSLFDFLCFVNKFNAGC